MGTWGTGIYQNDVSEDIRSDFIDKCKRGHTIEEATEIFIEDYAEQIEDEDDAPNFWYALADIQWKYGKLLPKVKENALYHIENDLKNKRYDEFDAGDAKKRKKALETLREKLNSPMPPEKKISRYRFYKCEWKVGDTFAYPLDTEIWKDSDFYGDYLIIQKIGERDWWPGNVIPIVRIKITENKKIPQNMEEIEKLKYIMFFKVSQGKNDYMIALDSSSKRVIPKKLIYMGNYDIFKSPSDEVVVDFDEMYECSAWKDLDERILSKVKKNFLVASKF